MCQASMSSSASAKRLRLPLPGCNEKVLCHERAKYFLMCLVYPKLWDVRICCGATAGKKSSPRKLRRIVAPHTCQKFLVGGRERSRKQGRHHASQLFTNSLSCYSVRVISRTGGACPRPTGSGGVGGQEDA
eukprot:3245029-Amphidinium_carterae.1